MIILLKAVLSKKDLTQIPEYYGYVSDLLCDRNIRHLADYSHHCGTTRLQHSLNVSYYNYKLCRLFKLDAKAGARAGLFHDLFFYNCHEHTKEHIERWHIVRHPKIAFYNTCELYPVSIKESDMILNHMWPLTPRFPRYREGYVITLVDKFCAVAEVMTYLCSKSVSKLKLASALTLMLLVKLHLH